MKPTATLMDAVYRYSFQRETNFGWQSNAAMRKTLADAKRFVLDEKMSAFLAHIANEGFATAIKGIARESLRHRLVEQMRYSARSPHRAVWIEYDSRAWRKKTNELGLARAFAPWQTPQDVSIDEQPLREGWLIRQHPKLDTAFDLHIFLQSPGEPDDKGFEMWTHPFAYGWNVDDAPLPWAAKIDAGRGERMSSEAYLGVVGYRSTNVAAIQSDLLFDVSMLSKRAQMACYEQVYEWTGTMRRVWALLANINDIPMQGTEIVPQRGFVARGSYRKFLSHRTLTLTIPGGTERRVARTLVATMRGRIRHNVRGHWRRDWRNPGSRLCEPHQWNVENVCERCGGHRMWITEHERGDASLGYRTHDYRVTHENENGGTAPP